MGSAIHCCELYFYRPHSVSKHRKRFSRQKIPSVSSEDLPGQEPPALSGYRVGETSRVGVPVLRLRRFDFQQEHQSTNGPAVVVLHGEIFLELQWIRRTYHSTPAT